MPRDGKLTRDRILEVAHQLVLRQGYSATSIDQILERAKITKGTFFYHFKSKEELARALLDQYLAGEAQVLENTLRRADKLTSDPLQQVLLTIGFFEEMFGALATPHPGCLIASYLYQNDLMTPEATALSREAFLIWRRELGAKLRAAAAEHRPRIDIDFDALADMLNTVIEGGMVLSKLFDDPKLLSGQLRQLRHYVELVFAVERSS